MRLLLRVLGVRWMGSEEIGDDGVCEQEAGACEADRVRRNFDESVLEVGFDGLGEEFRGVGVEALFEGVAVDACAESEVEHGGFSGAGCWCERFRFGDDG